MDQEKGCPRCGLIKPLADFPWRDAEHTRIQSYCRDCANETWGSWYADEANRRRHLAQLAVRRRRRIDRNRAIIGELKSEPCADCGAVFPPYVMDFDHVGEKTRRDRVARFFFQHRAVVGGNQQVRGGVRELPPFPDPAPLGGARGIESRSTP